MKGRKQLESLVIRKAWREHAFQQQMIEDAKGTIERVLQRKLPDEVRIFVHVEDENNFHFSLPPMPNEQEILSDDELERASTDWQTWARFLSGVASGVTFSIAGNAW